MQKGESEKKQITIYDISRTAGVSTATVSRVLNNSPKVRPNTRKKVLEIIEDLGYTPNDAARGLGSGVSKTIGILVADLSDMYLANAVFYLERELHDSGFHTILNCTGYDHDRKIEGFRFLEAKSVDAIITVGSHYVDEQDSRNKYIIDTATRLPVMMINGYIKGDNIYCTLANEKEAYYDAVNYLVSTGSRRIAFIYSKQTYSARKKLDGYKAALTHNSIELDKNLIIQGGISAPTTKSRLADLNVDCSSFDAVIATSDELAIGTLKYLVSNSVNVPSQVKIVGCNNSDYAQCSEPEITSIDNQCEILCIDTIGTLMRVLDGQSAPQKTVIDCTLIERRSTLE